MLKNNNIDSYTLGELNHLFQYSRAGVGFSMIPVEKGSLVGVVSLRGEIL